MTTGLRHLAAGVVIALAAGGVSYAAAGHPGGGSTRGAPAALPSSSPRVHPTPAAAAHRHDPTRTPKPTPGVARSTEGCPEGFTGNHGKFVSSSDDKASAARSDCGKPVPAVSHSPEPTESVEPTESLEPEESPEPTESPEPSEPSEGMEHAGHDVTTQPPSPDAHHR